MNTATGVWWGDARLLDGHVTGDAEMRWIGSMMAESSGWEPVAGGVCTSVDDVLGVSPNGISKNY